MLRAIAVSGHKKSGKTSIIEGLIPEMIERGYRVGTVKHIPDADFDFDRPDTDTWRHKKSGSEKVVVLTPKDGCATLGSSVTLYVDGNQIPLKGFVINLISKVVDGIVSSLKEGEGDHIELEVRKDQR